MTKRRNGTPADEAHPADDRGQIRDDEGLLVDEYSSDAFEDPAAGDALDAPRAQTGDASLEQIAEGDDGFEEIDLMSGGPLMDTVDTGARSRPSEDTDMGLGAEPHSPEELEDAAIGHALRGPRGVTRDDEVHGERLLDSPYADDENDDDDDAESDTDADDDADDDASLNDRS